MQKRLLVCGMVVTLAMSVACSDHVTTPAAPSTSLTSGSGAAAADEVTLKVTAPTQQSPQNGGEVDSITPNLVIANATAQYAEAGTAIRMLKYRFAVETAAGVSVHQNTTDSGDALTGFRIPADLLERGVTYRWRARAELNSSAGPWSAYWTFTTPKSAESLPSYPDGERVVGQPRRRQDDRRGHQRPLRSRTGRRDARFHLPHLLHAPEHADLRRDAVPGREPGLRHQRRQDEGRQHAGGLQRFHRQPVPLQRREAR